MPPPTQKNNIPKKQQGIARVRHSLPRGNKRAPAIVGGSETRGPPHHTHVFIDQENNRFCQPYDGLTYMN